MEEFAALIDALVYTRSRNEKLRLIAEYLKATPDPDRGWALAALADGLDFPAVKSSTIRNLLKDRVDPVLWTLSRDFVGDTAETASLLWPAPQTDPDPPTVSETVELLAAMNRKSVVSELPRLLDRLDASGRYALLKLATGGMRIGVSSRLAKTAFAQTFEVPVEDVEEYWHGLEAPYDPLFGWAARGEDPPDIENLPTFRPFMLAHPLEETVVDLADYAAEWKWDGIRVQAAAHGDERRLYSRTGEDISAAFPDIVDRMEFSGALDGELIVRRGDEVAPFGDLQKRLNRKTASKALLSSHPAALRLYDILIWDDEDLRGLPFHERRTRLEAAVTMLNPLRFDASPLLDFDTWDALAAHRADPPAAVIEGVMLKRLDSAYVAGRPRGPWFKWKRDPMIVDAVLLYAQRGHGKRSGFYSDFTFGVWDDDRLVPVGKAYSGFTDEELKRLDKFVRQNTVERFGPVRSLSPELVVEVAFEGLNRSKRHKSGVAMRFPRISRIRWDKPAKEADHLTTLEAMLP